MAFDWRSRLTWIGRTDSGVVRQRLYDRGILGIGLSTLDPGAKTWAAAIRKEAGFPFFYSDPHWHGLAGDGSALKYRQLLDSQIASLALPSEMLMLDLEQVSAEYVRRLLNGAPGNRGLVGSNNPSSPTGTQAGRPIAYTNEPFKDGTVVPYKELYLAGLHFYPQLYYGDMSPADPAAVMLDLGRWLYPTDNVSDVIHPFYDGMRIASDQRDGAYFTAERIAGVFTVTQLAAKLASAGERMGLPHRDLSFTKDTLRAHYTQLAQAA